MSDRLTKLLLALALGLPALTLYQLSCGSTVFWQDCGVYLAAVRGMGVAYQPGFPLYIVLAKLATLLLFFVPFARAVFAFSGLCAAIAVALCGLTVFDLVRPRHGRAIAAAASVVVGWSVTVGYSLWYQANNAEVYAFHAALWAATLYCVLVLLDQAGRDDPAAGRRGLLAACVLFGLGLANHPSMFLLAPLMSVAALLALLRLRIRLRFVLLSALIGLACAALPYALLPLFALGRPYLVMGDVLSWDGLVQHVTMRTFVGEQSNFGYAPERPGYLLTELWWQYRWSLALLALGAAAAAWERTRVLLLCLLAALPLIVIDMLYLKGGEWDMWLIAAWVSLAPLLGLGAARLLAWLGRVKPLLWLGCVVLALACALPQALANFPYVDRRDNQDARDFGMNHLRKLPPGAVLIAKGDPVCSTISYLQAVEGVRPDVQVIWYPMLGRPWYRRWAAARFPELRFSVSETQMPSERAAQIFIADNIGKRRIFLNQTYSDLPRPPAFFYQVPAGTLTELRRQLPQGLDRAFWDYRYSDPLWFRRPARPHGHRREGPPGAQHSIRVTYEQDMRYFELQGWLDWARFNMSIDMPQLAIEGFDRILLLVPEFDDVNTLNMFVMAYYNVGRFAKAREILERMVQIDPQWPPAYVTLAEVSRRLGDHAAARRYIEKAQSLDPQILERMGLSGP